eukprot:4348743-Pleurochrysis_carterae.AAC.1
MQTSELQQVSRCEATGSMKGNNCARRRPSCLSRRQSCSSGCRFQVPQRFPQSARATATPPCRSAAPAACFL